MVNKQSSLTIGKNPSGKKSEREGLAGEWKTGHGTGYRRKTQQEKEGSCVNVENDLKEIPQTEIPDEVRQVDVPEIGETTPHPKPESPLATGETAGRAETVQDGESDRPIGFATP